MFLKGAFCLGVLSIPTLSLCYTGSDLPGSFVTRNNRFSCFYIQPFPPPVKLLNPELKTKTRNAFGQSVPLVLVGMVVVLLSTGFKVIWNAYDEWNHAEALAATKPERALDHYERVIHWHVPFLSLSDDAAEKMWAYALRSEEHTSELQSH